MGSTMRNARVGIIGGGAWGTSLGIHCARIGHQTIIWALESEVVESINGNERENKTYFPGFKIPENMRATLDLEETVNYSDFILMVVPTPFIENTIVPVAYLLKNTNKILVSCSKGILNDTLETVDDILHRVLPVEFHQNLAYLSGPSFAKEVAEETPAAVTIAAKDETVAKRIQHTLSTARFRCYRTNDISGVELGGALKNVLAIACGISDGLNYGNNARAALITRGLNEITRLAVGKGANPLTMGGLAGMGDLVLTCTSDLSRNRTVGWRIGKGEKMENIKKSMKAVAEGVLTSKAAFDLSKKLNIDCPIIEGIYKVIYLDADPVKVVYDVMTRELKEEIDVTISGSLIRN